MTAPFFFYYMQLFSSILIAQLSDSLPGVLGTVAAMAISFLLITLIASYYRFQHIVENAEHTQPEEMGVTNLDILRVQLARYLAHCARNNLSFSLTLIRITDPEMQISMDGPGFNAVKHAARCNDVICVYDEQTVALLVENEPGDTVRNMERVAKVVATEFNQPVNAFCRVGIASYPGHGLNGKLLLEVAHEGLGRADAVQPVVMPEIIDPDAKSDEVDELEESSALAPEKSTASRRRRSMLDELTGVLKPSAISPYMQRAMSDLRYKKKNIALFCIGVNNMEYIERIHGTEAANDVLAGVSQSLQKNLRFGDLIGRHEQHAFLVLAEASLEQCAIIGKRITHQVQLHAIETGGKKIKAGITLGVAVCPDHGRSLHALYKAGQKVLDHSRANDIRAYAVYNPEIHDSMPSKPMRSIKSVKA